ncbi:DUF6584 family protein [Flavobacterium sp. RHBU_3]|uniref:DUF6584 family protein n=1 Tax=Flavobacterium sp. RHBU_3 TaxID=3391184 RepID=UPI003984C181
MDIGHQLRIAKQEANAGLKQKAVHRLRSAINAYPDDLRVREALAELYYEAGFADMAGLYWLLSSPENARKGCVDLYMKSINYSAQQALHDLKYRGNKKNLPDYARQKLEALKQEADDINQKSYKENPNASGKSDSKGKSYGSDAGCIFLLVLVLFAFIAGLVNVLQFIKDLFR